tara:strand:- start:842 stop:1132 length:291 start_codon:yes stop_codon:yes gene_type:complete
MAIVPDRDSMCVGRAVPIPILPEPATYKRFGCEFAFKRNNVLLLDPVTVTAVVESIPFTVRALSASLYVKFECPSKLFPLESLVVTIRPVPGFVIE